MFGIDDAETGRRFVFDAGAIACIEGNDNLVVVTLKSGQQVSFCENVGNVEEAYRQARQQ